MVFVGTRGQSNEGHHWQVQGDGQDESARGAGILYILCHSIIAGITDKYKEMGKVGLHEAQVFFIYCALLLLLASLTVQGDGQDDPAWGPGNLFILCPPFNYSFNCIPVNSLSLRLLLVHFYLCFYSLCVKVISINTSQCDSDMIGRDLVMLFCDSFMIWWFQSWCIMIHSWYGDLFMMYHDYVVIQCDNVSLFIHDMSWWMWFTLNKSRFWLEICNILWFSHDVSWFIHDILWFIQDVSSFIQDM